mgnify:CR=1 FL=1
MLTDTDGKEHAVPVGKDLPLPADGKAPDVAATIIAGALMVAFSGDASSILDMKFHSVDPLRGYGEFNGNRYANPALDQCIEASGATAD